jgi:sugar porter (SP) family MFS transporter
MIVFGILIAFISNYLLKGVAGENDWRLMLGVETIPAIAYTIMVLYIPESPRWLLVKKNDEAAARKVFEKVGNKDIDKSIKDILKSIEPGTSGVLWKKIYFKPIMLAVLIAFFNQMSGINFTLYYAPEILERAGLASKESLMNSISLGIVNLIFTILAIYLIDRIGRKKLLLWGSIGYILSLVMVSWAFYTGASSGFLLFFICFFVASHAIGQGAVIWVFISEIFPNNVRAYGQALGAGTHWIMAAIVTLLIPVFLDKESGIFGDNPWPIFAFFAVFMVIQLFWIIFKVPETKGKSLEELGAELSGKGK